MNRVILGILSCWLIGLAAIHRIDHGHAGMILTLGALAGLFFLFTEILHCLLNRKHK